MEKIELIPGKLYRVNFKVIDWIHDPELVWFYNYKSNRNKYSISKKDVLLFIGYDQSGKLNIPTFLYTDKLIEPCYGLVNLGCKGFKKIKKNT